jgi:hypothetical protein
VHGWVETTRSAMAKMYLIRCSSRGALSDPGHERASQLGVRTLPNQCQILSSDTWFLISILLGSEMSLEVGKDVAELSHSH